MSSDVAHYRGLTYWGPVHPARMESILDLLKLTEGDVALDVGCGRAEILLRLVERFGVSAIGVDRSESAIAWAREEAVRRGLESRLELSSSDVADFVIGDRAFDLVSWIGGPYLGRGLADTVRTLASFTRPGGYLLWGHGFWETDPPAEYLEETGMSADELGSHANNLSLARAAALTLLYTCVSNRDEWDEFEGRILYNWEERRLAEPNDPELRIVVDRKRRWNDAQQRWGRGVMGFGLYLFRREDGDGPVTSAHSNR